MKIAVITQNFPVREAPYQGHSVYQTVLRMAALEDVKVFSPHTRYLNLIKPQNRTWIEVDVSYDPGGVDTQYLNYAAIAGLTRPINGYVCASAVLPLLKRKGVA